MPTSPDVKEHDELDQSTKDRGQPIVDTPEEQQKAQQKPPEPVVEKNDTPAPPITNQEKPQEPKEPTTLQEVAEQVPTKEKKNVFKLIEAKLAANGNWHVEFFTNPKLNLGLTPDIDSEGHEIIRLNPPEHTKASKRKLILSPKPLIKVEDKQRAINRTFIEVIDEDQPKDKNIFYYDPLSGTVLSKKQLLTENTNEETVVIKPITAQADTATAVAAVVQETVAKEAPKEEQAIEQKKEEHNEERQAAPEMLMALATTIAEQTAEDLETVKTTYLAKAASTINAKPHERHVDVASVVVSEVQPVFAEIAPSNTNQPAMLEGEIQPAEEAPSVIGFKANFVVHSEAVSDQAVEALPVLAIEHRFNNDQVIAKQLVTVDNVSQSASVIAVPEAISEITAPNPEDITVALPPTPEVGLAESSVKPFGVTVTESEAEVQLDPSLEAQPMHRIAVEAAGETVEIVSDETGVIFLRKHGVLYRYEHTIEHWTGPQFMLVTNIATDEERVFDPVFNRIVAPSVVGLSYSIIGAAPDAHTLAGEISGRMKIIAIQSLQKSRAAQGDKAPDWDQATGTRYTADTKDLREFDLYELDAGINEPQDVSRKEILKTTYEEQSVPIKNAEGKTIDEQTFTIHTIQFPNAVLNISLLQGKDGELFLQSGVADGTQGGKRSEPLFLRLDRSEPVGQAADGSLILKVSDYASGEVMAYEVLSGKTFTWNDEFYEPLQIGDEENSLADVGLFTETLADQVFESMKIVPPPEMKEQLLDSEQAYFDRHNWLIFQKTYEETGDNKIHERTWLAHTKMADKSKWSIADDQRLTIFRPLGRDTVLENNLDQLLQSNPQITPQVRGILDEILDIARDEELRGADRLAELEDPLNELRRLRAQPAVAEATRIIRQARANARREQENEQRTNRQERQQQGDQQDNGQAQAERQQGQPRRQETPQEKQARERAERQREQQAALNALLEANPQLAEFGLVTEDAGPNASIEELIESRLTSGLFRERQGGTVPKPLFIGLRSVDEYVPTERVARYDLADHFHAEYEKLINHSDTVTRDAYRKKLLEYMDIVYAQSSASDIRIDYAHVEGTNQLIKEGERFIRDAKLQIKVNNTWTDVPNMVFRYDRPEDHNNLLLLQHVLLERTQKEWVKEKLDKASRYASSEDELRLALNEIRQGQRFFLGEEVNRYFDMVSTLFEAKRRFQNAGTLPGSEFEDYAHELMNLPGVAEVMAELEEREIKAKWKWVDGRLMRLNSEEEKAVKAEMTKNGTDVGGLNITSTNKQQSANDRETLRKITASLIAKADVNYGNWLNQKGIVAIEDKIKKADDPELKFQLERRLREMKSQKVDTTSVQVAEWIWRMAGRGAFFGDQAWQGQSRMYEVVNYGRWAISKDKAKANNAVMKLAFGTASAETVDQWAPGTTGGENLGVGWFGYFTDYAIFAPGTQVKKSLTYSNIDKYVSNEDREIIEGLKKKFATWDVSKIPREEVASRLTNQERAAIARWNYAPTMQIGLDVFQRIRDDSGVWADWSDYEKDLQKAERNKDELASFLANPTLSAINKITDSYWNRYWKFRGEGSLRMLNVLIEYKQRFNKALEGQPNWNAHQVDKAIMNAIESGATAFSNKRELDRRHFARKILIQPGWPLTMFGKKVPWEIKLRLPEPLEQEMIWASKYNYVPRGHIKGLAFNIWSSIWKDKGKIAGF